MAKKVTIKDASDYNAKVSHYKDVWKYLEHGIVVPVQGRVYVVPRFTESPLFKNINDVEFEMENEKFDLYFGYPVKVHEDGSFTSMVVPPKDLKNPELETSYYRLNLFGIQGDPYPFTHLRCDDPEAVKNFIHLIVTKGMELEVAVFDSVK